jgi:hypothetical protein
MDDVVEPLPILVTLLAGLVACLFGVRALRARGLGDLRAEWVKGAGSPAGWALAIGAATLASWPMLGGIGALVSRDAMLPGDASSHAVVAQEIARHGLPHGWVDAHNGGWLFGPHYQPLPVLFLAALIRLGADAKLATQATGVAAVVLLPPLFVAVMRRAGARPLPALLGALLLAWATPFQAYIGGPRVYVSQGVVSQAFALPIVVAAASVIASDLRGRRRVEPLLGAIAIASHAQLSLCALALGFAAMLVAGDRGVRVRFARTAAGAIAMGAALYVPGARMVQVPVSWAKVPETSIIGYPPGRLPSWLLDGKLLDNGRAPVLTGLLLVAALVLLFSAAAPNAGRAPRAALALVVVTLGFSVSGHAVVSLGALTAKLVEIFSPVRMLCFVPVSAALALSVAVTEVSARLERAVAARGARAARGLEMALIAIVALGAGVPTSRWLVARVAHERTLASHECSPGSGYRTEEVATWLAGIEGGRFVVDPDSFHGACPLVRGIELASPVATGGSMGGPGSQLGVNHLAFEELHASRPGGAGRAESLGVRYVLHTDAHPPLPRERFQVIASRGDVALSRRIDGSDRIGAGCITARWRGDDRALRDALFDDLSSASPVTNDPASLTLLESAPGPVAREAVAPGACSATWAVVSERPREPGAFEAFISAPHDVVAVVRATWTPTWRVLVDGVEATPMRVAPGFLAVSVPMGDHHLEAIVAPPRGYAAGIAAAALVVALLAVLSGKLR